MVSVLRLELPSNPVIKMTGDLACSHISMFDEKNVGATYMVNEAERELCHMLRTILMIIGAIVVIGAIIRFIF